MFGGGLCDAFLELYREELPEINLVSVEEDCQRGEAALAAALTKEQRETLAQIQESGRAQTESSLPIGFSRGVFAAYQQYFTNSPVDNAFETLVIDQALTMPQMMEFPSYYQNSTRLLELEKELGAQLSKEEKEHLVCILAAWENRVYAVLRHSFYLGYRWASSAIIDVEKIQSMGKVNHNLLLTEHRLGYTKTVKEREGLRRGVPGEPQKP